MIGTPPLSLARRGDLAPRTWHWWPIDFGLDGGRWLQHAFAATVVVGMLLGGAAVRPAPAPRVESPRTGAWHDGLVVQRFEDVEAPTGVAPRRFPPAVERWREVARAVAASVAVAEGVRLSEDLLLALVATESSGEPAALSAAGALGLAQVREAAFADMVARHPRLFDRADRSDPAENLLAGALYLVWCARFLGVDMSEESGLRLALNAYNYGPAALRAHLDFGSAALPIETRLHADRTVAALAPPTR